MEVYNNWKWTNGEKISGDNFIIEITREGVSWYDLMVELDEQSNRSVVCVSPEGDIAWMTQGAVSEKFAPSDGYSVIVTESTPFTKETWRDYKFDGEKFVEKPKVVGAVRTKEEIMADLLALQAELQKL